MRTPEEILQKCKDDDDVFGFTTRVLIAYLTFEQARPLLKPEATADVYGASVPLTHETVLEEMRSYMEFAWGKASDHRGLSASRSVAKMEAWAWLLGDDDLLKEIDQAGYQSYGAPKLAVVCRKFDFPIPQDEGIQNMIQGKPCRTTIQMERVSESE